MAKRRKRTCQHCGKEFKSWHAHVDCKPAEGTETVVDPATPEPEKPAFKPRFVVGGATMWMRNRG